MIGRVIEFSVRNRVVVITAVIAVSLWGVWCLYRTPVDAIPDLSENQVIVWADWPGRSPQEVEDQVTYPLAAGLQGLAGVKSVRSTSELGFAMVNVIFADGVDFYFARQRVLERLSTMGGALPAGVVPFLAPDATALGQIFWYTVEGGGKSLDELRAVQDWFVRYRLSAVEGVAQVASVGGFVREYQVDADPVKLRALDVTVGDLYAALAGSNSSFGGKVLHAGGAEHVVRGIGWLRGLDDIRQVVVKERSGVPIRVGEVAAVELGPAFRRGVLEKDGREAVGGVVMMRFGENPLAVTERIKARLDELASGLPEGVRVVPFYDRTGLIEASIDTLKRTLVEEIIIASLIVLLVLWHLRSAFVISVTLPVAVLVSFIFMHYLEIPSNIMSLCGIAISIGVLVDAGIVMTENAYTRLHDRFGARRVEGDTRQAIIDAAKVVGAPLVFSVLIMVLSFAPVFALSGMEGKMFHPLAYTKTFALIGVAVLAVTLVPALLPTFLRGRLRSQEEVWLVRSFVNVYRPMLSFFLRHPDVIIVVTGAVLLAGIPVFPRKVPWVFFAVLSPFLVTATVLLAARRKLLSLGVLLVLALAAALTIAPLGEEFMPPLDELSLLDMPITTPNVNITQASQDLIVRDSVLREFPEVLGVVGKLGRAETPTDPAPIDMVETVVTFKPREHWPARKVDFNAVREEVAGVVDNLAAHGALESAAAADAVAMGAAVRFDAAMRELCLRRFREAERPLAVELVRALRREVVRRVEKSGALRGPIEEAAWTAFGDEAAGRWGAALAAGMLKTDVRRATEEVLAFLMRHGAVESRQDLLAEAPGVLAVLAEPLRALTGSVREDAFDELRQLLVAERDRLLRQVVREVNIEVQSRAPGTLAAAAIAEAVEKAKAEGRAARLPGVEDLQALRREREVRLSARLLVRCKLKSDLQGEMDAALQVPGWANIWTQPIINRIDMLSTGVRTMVGVKVFGGDPATIQRVSEDVAAVLRTVRGAADVNVDQVMGESFLEVEIDRERAARYGVRVEDLEAAVESAVGGKEATSTVEGRQRFAVRVRYAPDWREDEEAVKGILVPAMGADGGGEAAPVAGAAPVPAAAWSGLAPRERRRQVPLSLVADVRVVTGPTMIKSEDGLLRSYVQLNVRDRDVVGFVEEAREAVASQVTRPPGCEIEWSGQFEHQQRAQRTLTLIFPAVVVLIFLILFLTYRDLADTLLMFLAVPGSIAGGALFQYLLGYNFSVAVWVGYIACFGLATETGIVMLVYLREAIDRRGGMDAIRSEDEVREAVMEGAVHRLRPKLLTEGTTILALIPMLWATGVGSEFLRPMAAPILGGILVADEVIDLLLPVLFYQVRCRRLRLRQRRLAEVTEGSTSR